MLHKYVKGSEGTCLFITAVHFLTEPFFNASYESPEDIKKALSTGITILQLWKRYLEIKKMRLLSQTNAAQIKERRGNFITYGAYTTSELLFSAGTLHSLAMYLHFKHLGPDVYSPPKVQNNCYREDHWTAAGENQSNPVSRHITHLCWYDQQDKRSIIRHRSPVRVINILRSKNPCNKQQQIVPLPSLAKERHSV